MKKKPVAIQRLTIIAGRKKRDKLLSLLTEHNAHLITCNYADGTITANFLENLIGLIPEEEKIMITCIIKTEQKDLIFEKLVTQMKFDQPNTGIAYTSKVDQLVF